jgi:3-oxoadipate enol-lactonase
MRTAVELHAVVEGPEDADVLVLSNSLGTTTAMWDPQMEELRRRFRVVRYDLRGHGESPTPPAPYDIADLGGDLLTLLDRLGVDRAHLCGLSIGGMIAMWVAANVPERVRRLILCCTSVRFDPPEAWAERAATVLAGGTQAVVDTVLGRWFTPAFAAEHPGTIAAMRADFVATSAEGYAACCGVAERTDLTPCLPFIQAPTLVIAAAQDPAAPPEQGRLIADGIRGARLRLVEGAAHLATIERPDDVTGLILAHLLDPSLKEDP